MSAFQNCYSLRTVTLPNSITSIGISAFANCSGITTITFPNSVISIGEKAFANCSGITTITFGNNVASIDSYAFSSCSALSSIMFGNKIISIGNSSFNNCYSLINIIIPNSVRIIGENAFFGCDNLSSITIGSNVESIGRNAFTGCFNLTNITIKTTNDITESISFDAFEGCPITMLVYETIGFTLLNFERFKNKIEVINFSFPIPSSKSMKRLQETPSLPTLTHFTRLHLIIIENINDFVIPEFFVQGDNVEIYIANSIKYIDPKAFKDCSIIKFTYLGTDKLEGNFLKNAKSCKEVITSANYRDD
ncbi:surface antigen BspA-like [Trichomonas vaginalis G3]|uniref:Surface antigen BspA-like n=1 Tax=Trichomonas vaginalis (strain ATCC PRA-98 / G3) TaxID=412133 RepID=A2DV45_TRIV3|nr:surface antigen BspA-like [Trichomonas vaginalis G3]|eukprot:XP_001327995.1 surface antigen BspA-like [Trichomonas vaginalis G3]